MTSTTIKSRIGELVWLYHFKLKQPYEKMLGRGVFGKELVGLLNTPEIQATGRLLTLRGAPMPYEVQFDMSNAGDCTDWIADNNFIKPLTTVNSSVIVGA